MLLHLLAALVLGSSAQQYTCQNQTIALGPNGYQMQTPPFAPLQNCILQFSWPADQFANLTIIVLGGIGDYDLITPFSTGTDGRSINQTFAPWMYQGPHLNVAWPPSTVSVQIVTGNVTYLMISLNIQLQPFSVQNAQTTKLHPVKGDQPFYMPFGSFSQNTAISVESTNQICLKRDFDYKHLTSLSNFFVYEGTGNNLKLIGTMYMIDFSNWPKNTNFTIYAAANVYVYGMIMINDNQNNPQNYNFLYFAGGDISIKLSSDYTSSGWTVANDEIYPMEGVYITKIINQNDSPMSLLAGAPIGESNSTVLATYGITNTDQLPQFVPSSKWSFLASTISLDIAIFFKSIYAPPTHLAINKKTGFIVSDNYPFLSSNQSSSVPFLMETGDFGPFTIAFTIVTKSSNKDATVVIDAGNVNPITINLNSITVPYTRAYTTKKVSLVINGGSAPSNGTYITYSVASTLPGPV